LLKNKTRLLIIAAGTAAAVAVLVILTFMNQGFLDIYRAYRQDRELTLNIKAAQAEADSLRSEIERLESDTAYIVRIAREKIGMARKEEKIVKFVEVSD
jgi:cell division protein FtsB